MEERVEDRVEVYEAQKHYYGLSPTPYDYQVQSKRPAGIEPTCSDSFFNWQPQPTTACRGDPQPRQGGRTGGWDCLCVITLASTGTVSGRPSWRMTGRAVSRGGLQLQISNFPTYFISTSEVEYHIESNLFLHILKLSFCNNLKSSDVNYTVLLCALNTISTTVMCQLPQPLSPSSRPEHITWAQIP